MTIVTTWGRTGFSFEAIAQAIYDQHRGRASMEVVFPASLCTLCYALYIVDYHACIAKFPFMTIPDACEDSLFWQRLWTAGKEGTLSYDGMGRRFTYLFRPILCAAPFRFLLQHPDAYDSDYEDLDHVADRRMNEAQALYEETLVVVKAMGKELTAILGQKPRRDVPGAFLQGFMNELFCQEIALASLFDYPSVSFCDMDVYEVTNTAMPWRKQKPDFSMCVWHPVLKTALQRIAKYPYFRKYPENLPLYMQPEEVLMAAKQEARKRSDPNAYCTSQKRQKV